jgi:hypothetical protein
MRTLKPLAQFSSGGATFTYDADGHTGTLPLVREPF